MKTECPVCFNIGRHGDGCPVAQRELDAMKRGAEKAAAQLTTRMETLRSLGDPNIYGIVIHELGVRRDNILTASSKWTTEDLK